MSASLVLTPGSAPLVEIAGPGGEVSPYRLLPCPPGLDEWAAWVERAGDQAGRYRVAVDHRGVWRCSCKAWKYRAGEHGPDKLCKHSSAVKAVREFISEMGGES